MYYVAYLFVCCCFVLIDVDGKRFDYHMGQTSMLIHY